MFESVNVKFSAFLSGTAEVKVWVENKELHYSKDIMMNPIDDDTDDSVSDMSVDEFLNRIEALKILGWKKNYSPVGYVVMDGETWTVNYSDSDHKTYKIEGDNVYPENWTDFMNLMSEVVGYFWDYEE